MRRILMITAAFGIIVAACSSGDDSNAAFCESAKKIQDVQADSASNITEPDQFKDLFQQTASSATELAENAPSDIKDAADTLAEQINAINATLESVDYNINELTPEQQEEFASQDLADASQQVTEFIQTECDVDLSGETSDTGADSGGQPPDPAADPGAEGGN